MFGKAKAQTELFAVTDKARKEWDNEDRAVAVAALNLIDELVSLQMWLDETTAGKGFRVNTPEYAIKMITLLIANRTGDTVASELMTQMMRERDEEPEEEEEEQDSNEHPAWPFLGDVPQALGVASAKTDAT